MSPAGNLAHSNPVLRQLGLRTLGRPARGHLLLTKTLLIVGQEGGTHREGELASLLAKWHCPVTRRERRWYMVNNKQFIALCLP
jgi:hypothetical protein